MTIRIKLYGDLKEKAPQFNIGKGVPSTLNIEIDNFKTVLDILNKFSMEKNEISHVFVNSKYSGLEKEVKNGDRIGIFPKRMGVLFVEIRNPF